MTLVEQNAFHAVANYLPRLVKELVTANKLRAIELAAKYPNNPTIQNVLDGKR